MYTAYERDLGSGYITVDPRIPLSPGNHPTPGPTAQFRLCRHPAIPLSNPFRTPTNSVLIGTGKSHNQASAAPRQLHRVRHS